MRKLAAILLWGILFFNWIGYRLLSTFLEERASRRLEARLDRQQYDESLLVSMKVPVTHLVYYNNSLTFQRANGQIEINGVPYRFVASRIFNDSLEMLCIRNVAALKVRYSDNDYFKLVNDVGQGSKSSENSHLSRAFNGEPFTCIELVGIDNLHYTLVKSGYHFFTSLVSLTLPPIERPPISAAV